MFMKTIAVGPFLDVESCVTGKGFADVNGCGVASERVWMEERDVVGELSFDMVDCVALLVS